MKASNSPISGQPKPQRVAYRLIELPEHADARGKLAVVEGGVHIPFQVQRAFFLYEVPQGAQRAGHALKTCHEFLIAVHGSFRIRVRDGISDETFVLDRPNVGFYLPPMLWCDLDEFSAGAVCLVFASTHYDTCEQIRNWDEFQAALRGAG